ncbi:ABC transporter permease [Shinella sp.]|uniref:ABC transporter permease n=1 Tax=Shinella sp. TaxID=1870904 RepID=UPI0025849880|nr:ABC transporter permease [Shinella sp.]MCW5710571.1 ABC transporter permease [Shinella sp.]
MTELLQLVSFGPDGWGLALLTAALMTVAVAACGFLIGGIIGAVIAWGKLAGNLPVRFSADAYTTVLRGIPDLLVIYLFYFGGSMAVTGLFNLWGDGGFVGVPPFAAGATAIGVVSGAYQSEVFRGAFRVLSKGEIEAGKAAGMSPFLLFRRIIAPQVFRHALPGIGNVWQMALKESALISVTGLVELLRQSQIAAGSTRKPFEFYLIAGAIFLVITWLSQRVFSWLEKRARRSMAGGLV